MAKIKLTVLLADKGGFLQNKHTGRAELHYEN